MAEQLHAVTELADEAARTSSFIERVADAFDTIDQAAGKATVSLSASNREAAEAVQTAEELGTRFFVAFRESAMGNRRTKRRFPASIPVTLHLPGGPLTLNSIDISLDGIRLALPAVVDRAMPDELRLTIDGVGTLEARVVGRERRALRACFLASEPASQAGLDDLISRLDQKYGGLVTMMRDTASMINGAFVNGVRCGRVSEQALFDHDYVPVPGTNPQQYTTSGLAFFEEILPAIQDPVPATDPKIEFCVAVDINGWLPVHQRRLSLPQRPGDTPWNIANCRNRRIYDSKIGAFAARAMRPYILQACARDMGGSEPMLIATIDVPLQLLGRNWGGLRLGYRL
jgi:methyl-accepting chemotaxis protein